MTVSHLSDKPKYLGLLASLGFVALGVIISIVAVALFSFAPPVHVWRQAQSAFDLPAQLVSIAFFTWSAVREEIAKVLGALTARLGSNCLSWWVIAALIGALFGSIERALLLMNWTTEYLAHFTPMHGLVLDAAAVLGHAALCVLSVGIARTFGGTWLAWFAGVFTAGVLHAAHNLLPRFVDLGWSFAWPILSTSVMSAILISTFLLRERIAQRFTRRSRSGDGGDGFAPL